MDRRLLLTNAYISGHPLDAARVLEGLTDSEQAALLNTLSPALCASLLELCDSFLTVALISSLPLNKAADILDKFPVDKAVLVLNKTAEETRGKILEKLPEARATTLIQLMTFPADSAGALMDPQVLTLPEDITVGEAKHKLAGNAGNVIYYLYILDRSHKLKGMINIRDLFMAEDGEILSAKYKACTWVLRPFQRITQILKNPGWLEIHALPVVDENTVFLGAIGYRTLRNIELRNKGKQSESGIYNISTALGELYWLGVTGLLRGFYAGFSEKNK